MASNVKRILLLAAIALAGFIVRSPLGAAGPPGHIVRLGILDALVPTFDPTADPGEFVANSGIRPGATSSSSTNARAISRQCHKLPRNSCGRGWTFC